MTISLQDHHHNSFQMFLQVLTNSMHKLDSSLFLMKMKIKKKLGGTPHGINIKPFEDEESEEKVYTSLDDLHQGFSKLAKNFKFSFREKNKHNSQLATDVSEWLTAHMKWEEGSVDNSLDDIFKKIQPYYDFIDCKLLLDMSNEFLRDVTFTDGGVTYKLVDELRSHTRMSKRLRVSNTVSELKKLLQEHYKPFNEGMNNLPCIHIHLQTCWDDISIDGLYKLIEKFLPQKYRQSIVKHITIFSGSVVIKLEVLDFTADSLIEYTGGKLQFMHLIGIFSLYINDHPVLQEDENMNFTFELALLEAVTAGNNEAVEFLLQLETVNIDHTNEKGKTALMLACKRGHEDIVLSLLSAGADVNIQDNKGWTALMIGSKHDYISIIHMLLQANANPHLTISDGSNVSMMASIDDNYKAFEQLISEGGNLLQEAGMNALMLACKNGHTEIVELLLEEQVIRNDLNVLKSGRTALMIATGTDDSEIAELLLKAGADSNIQIESSINPLLNGTTPLMIAAINDNIQTVQSLLEAGADPNKATMTGETALKYAVTYGTQCEIVDELIKAGASTNFSTYNPIINTTINCTVTQCCVMEIATKNTPLTDINQAMQLQNITVGSAINMTLQQMRAQGDTKQINMLQHLLEVTPQPEADPYSLLAAAEAGCTPAVELLLKAGYDPLALSSSSKLLGSIISGDASGYNALTIACQNGHIEIVELILQRPVDLNAMQDNGLTPLMAACNAENDNLEIVQLLLEAGADPNLPIMVQASSISCPSLLFACTKGHLELVKFLLKEVGGNVNLQQETGETFLMTACDGGHKDIVLTLLESGADPNICDNDGDNALYYVLLSNSSEDNILDIIQTLLSWNINVNAQNNNGVTPLMIASEKGYSEVLLSLLSKVAGPDFIDKNGKTALVHASANGQSETVALLLMLYNADPSVTDYDKFSALCHGARNESIEVVEVLLNNYNPKQEELEKAVTAACYGGHKKIIELLSDKMNFTKHQRDVLTACMSDDMEFIASQTSSDLCTPLIESTGLTPLMIAASCGSDEVVQTLLLVHEADVNQQDSLLLKYSPLMYAVSGSKSISIVKSLLDSGANVNAYSKEEETPLDIARGKELNEIAQLLENNDGETYYYVAQQLSTKQISDLIQESII